MFIIQVRVIAGNTYTVMMGISVDDLLIIGNSVPEINAEREIMNRHYCLTDQGHLEYYLGVGDTQPDANTLMLHQAEYISKIFDLFNMRECTPVLTTLSHNLNPSLLDCPDKVDSKLQAEYTAFVGFLIYLCQ